MFRVLRMLTAGESHGPQLTAILDGLPAGLTIDPEQVAADMARRQTGYGRGGRMRIETDSVDFVGGVRFGKTTGAPVAVVVPNRDHENWREVMRAFGDAPSVDAKALSRPRPGHADLVGMLKYRHDDARDVLERASARETAARVALGSVCRQLLSAIGVQVFSHVVSIASANAELEGLGFEDIQSRSASNDMRAAEGDDRMRAEVDRANKAGDTVGGIFEVVVLGLPVGLGSSMSADRRLDGRLGAALLSIPAVKGAEIGNAFANTARTGSRVHDEIVAGSLGRSSNRAGGLEGGMTTGEALLCRGAMKPISTLKKPLKSVDMSTGETASAGFERSDTCAVPAAGIVGEAVVAMVLADALLESCGNDHLDQIRAALAERAAYQRDRAKPGDDD